MLGRVRRRQIELCRGQWFDELTQNRRFLSGGLRTGNVDRELGRAYCNTSFIWVEKKCLSDKILIGVSLLAFMFDSHRTVRCGTARPDTIRQKLLDSFLAPSYGLNQSYYQ